MFLEAPCSDLVSEFPSVLVVIDLDIQDHAIGFVFEKPLIFPEDKAQKVVGFSEIEDVFANLFENGLCEIRFMVFMFDGRQQSGCVEPGKEQGVCALVWPLKRSCVLWHGFEEITSVVCHGGKGFQCKGGVLVLRRASILFKCRNLPCPVFLTNTPAVWD